MMDNELTYPEVGLIASKLKDTSSDVQAEIMMYVAELVSKAAWAEGRLEVYEEYVDRLKIELHQAKQREMAARKARE